MRFFRRSYRVLFLLSLCLLPAFAQENDQEKMVYVTMRLFEVRVPRNQMESLSNQVFRLRTAAQTDDEKWLGNIKKAYPSAMDVSLLRSQQFRLFIRPRPGIIVLGDPRFPHLEAQVMIAQGLRDDDSINMTAITEVNFYSGAKSVQPIPMSMASNGFEIEPGNTYFYTMDSLRLRTDIYSVYFRDRCFSPKFEGFDPYLVLAVSCEPEKHTPLTFDVDKSAELQSKATKKVEPQWPEVIKEQALFGKILVRAEINAEGKVTNANVVYSTLPEGNLAALSAARKWEFPASELAGINAPASALLTFAVAPPPPPPQEPEKKPDEKPTVQPTQGTGAKPAGQTKPATTTPTAKKPPVKRSKK